MKCYLSVVRHSNIYRKSPTEISINNLIQHLKKSRLGFQYTITRETSKEGFKHLHALLYFEDEISKILMEEYIDLHRLRSYIDKSQEIKTEIEASYYLTYILKDFSKEHKKNIDFATNRENDKDIINDLIINQNIKEQQIESLALFGELEA